MKSWFQRRRYPEDVINSEMKKLVFTRNFSKSSNKNKGVQFVLIYHPLLKNVNWIIRKHNDLLYVNGELKKVFQPGPMASFGSLRNLSSYLVRNKLYPMERKTGSCKCNGNSCHVCLNDSETETLVRTVIRHVKLTISLTVMTNAWYIFWQVRPVLSSMLVVPQIVSDIVGTVINVLTENMREVKLACKNIFLNILIVKVTMDSYVTFSQKFGTSWS